MSVKRLSVISIGLVFYVVVVIIGTSKGNSHRFYFSDEWNLCSKKSVLVASAFPNCLCLWLKAIINYELRVNFAVGRKCKGCVNTTLVSCTVRRAHVGRTN